MEKDTIIEINNLKVKFNDFTALNLEKKISIKRGDTVGIIGANGAGKSTLINSIIGKVKYTGELKDNFLMNDLGVLLQNNSYNNLMKVYELIQLVTNKKINDTELNKSILEFNLSGILKNRISNLSGGEKQQLTLFLVLYQNPSVLIFDELTTGLDYQKRNELLNTVKEFSRNKTVITITHYFEELENWVNKILVLDKGKMLFYGKIEDFKNIIPHYSIIKIERDYSLDNEITENYKIINDFDSKNSAIILKTSLEQDELINKLSNKSIQYEVIFSNIYTTYSLLLKSRG